MSLIAYRYSYFGLKEEQLRGFLIGYLLTQVLEIIQFSK